MSTLRTTKAGIPYRPSMIRDSGLAAYKAHKEAQRAREAKTPRHTFRSVETGRVCKFCPVKFGKMSKAFDKAIGRSTYLTDCVVSWLAYEYGYGEEESEDEESEGEGEDEESEDEGEEEDEGYYGDEEMEDEEEDEEESEGEGEAEQEPEVKKEETPWRDPTLFASDGKPIKQEEGPILYGFDGKYIKQEGEN